MTTEVQLATGAQTWDDVSTALTESLRGLLANEFSGVTVWVPHTGQHIKAHRMADGQLRLAAAGNDELEGESRLTVRDERAVIAVGFSVASSSWGTFFWDWSAPVNEDSVCSGIIRTVRDIYKAMPAHVEVTAAF